MLLRRPHAIIGSMGFGGPDELYDPAPFFHLASSALKRLGAALANLSGIRISLKARRYSSYGTRFPKSLHISPSGVAVALDSRKQSYRPC